MPRQIRVKGKIKDKVKENAPKKKLADDLMEEVIDKEIYDLIDEGYKLDAEIKERKSRLEIIKISLLETAKLKGTKNLLGNKAEIVISPKKTISIEVKDLIVLAKKLGKKDAIFGMLKVAVTEVRKYIAPPDIEKISRVNIEEYGAIKFRKK